MWRSRLLGALLIAHGLAHAGPGMWASGRAPVEPVALLWWIASVGFVLAGFRVLRWPAPRFHPLLLSVVAAIASVSLLFLVRDVPVLVTGLAMDAVLVGLVMRMSRGIHVYSLDGFLAHPATARSRPSHPVRRRFGIAASALVLAWLSGAILLRPWHTTWGTSPLERSAPLPGDELVPDARYVMDHAVEIQAPPEAVWPWLVQIGQDRAGFYSHDWLERLIGDDVRSADRIHPEWQALEVGDLVRAVQPNYLGGVFGREIGWRVARVEPGRALVLENWGAFVLHRTEAGTTILHARLRGDGTPSVAAIPLGPIGLLAFEPAHFIMERGMLLGIRERAEGGGGGASAER